MKYINETSNRGIVNLFADFLVKEINKTNNYDVVVEVTDCGKFFVVNGMTNSDKILDMVTVKEVFLESNKFLLKNFGYENVNIIDLIVYNRDLKKKTDYTFDFYNSERRIYHNDILVTILESPQPKFNSITYNNRLEYELDYSEDDTTNLEYFTYSPLNITSEFPHGYSLSMGRQELYYSEYICNQLFDVILSTNRYVQLTFKYSSIKVDEDNQIDVSVNSIYPKKDIISMVLDVFDFDMLLFNDKIKDYDIMEDITNPFGDKPWLVKDRLKDLKLF
jgi:hypothetical protein